MGKLDVSIFGFLEGKYFRVLTAIEMGMKNHEIVPVELVATLAGLLHGGCFKTIKELCKNRLAAFEKGRKVSEGYRLTTKGYDFLALRAFCNAGLISSFGVGVGVGKESDVYTVSDSEGKVMAVKFHRLGRTSFRQVKNKREYHQNRTSLSWLYLSRISASNEFKFQKELFDAGFPVPEPYEHNRHAVLMEYVPDARLLQDYLSLSNAGDILDVCIGLPVRLAEYGLIHCDLNEFNLLVDEFGKIWLIDFPQMVSRNHPDANMFFERDITSLKTFFSRRFNLTLLEFPVLCDIKRENTFDFKLKAPGFDKSKDGLELLEVEKKLKSFCLSDDESVISTRTTMSAHPDPDYVKKRVKSERAAQEKKHDIKRAIKRGEASYINRRRRFDADLSNDWFLT